MRTRRLTLATFASLCSLVGVLSFGGASALADECPNALARAEQAFAQALPDCRAYELVTPADKGSGALPPEAGFGQVFYAPPESYGVNHGFQASANGDGMAFSVETPFPGAQAGALDNYLAVRRAGGWSSQSITPVQGTNLYSANVPAVMGYSADLSKAAFQDGESNEPGFGQDSPALVPGEPAHTPNLFLRDDATSAYQLMNLTPAGVTPTPAGFEGASADFSRIVFVSKAQLTPEAPAGGPDNLFEWHDGTVSLVGLVPTPPAIRCGGGGPACGVSAEGTVLGGGAAASFPAGFVNAVSPDGSRIFFNDIESDTGDGGQLYVREDGSTTVEISASQKTNGSGPGGSDPAGPRFPHYWLASKDGSKAFFTSCEQLTNDSTANASGTASWCTAGARGGGSEGNDLYQYNTSTETLSDLTVDRNGDPEGADVLAVLGASVDGSYVYFVANGVLASGASLGDCDAQPQEEGQCNLYVAHDGTTTLVARIDEVANWSDYPVSARVSADGTRLAFETPRSLTGYDNVPVEPGACQEEGRDTSCDEVYLYDATSNQLVCASCNPSGARPLGSSRLASIEGTPGNLSENAKITDFEYLPRSLSEDGARLFFNSSDALVPGDTNGREDAYEYDDGAPHLISSGTSDEGSTFLDASPSGDDAFFTTQSRLVAQDADQKFDIYDARVDGGFTSEPTTACTGTGCQGVPPAPPIFATPASVTFEGAGNFPPSTQAVVKPRRATVKCAKPKKLSHGKCVKAKVKKRRPRHAKKASDKRRAK